MNSKYTKNICHLRIPLVEAPYEPPDMDLGIAELTEAYVDVNANHDRPLGPQPAFIKNEVHKSKRITNVKRFDAYIDGSNLVLFVDVKKFMFQPKLQFDVAKIDKLTIKYNSAERYFEMEIPCIPMSTNELVPMPSSKVLIAPNSELSQFMDYGQLRLLQQQFAAAANRTRPPSDINLATMKHITGICELQIDGNVESILETDFAYGFGSSYNNLIGGLSLELQPSLKSPVQRLIECEKDETKNFSVEQYKSQFLVIQMGDRRQHPTHYIINYKNVNFNLDRLTKLKSIILHASYHETSDHYRQIDINYGLVNVLLAIIYDIRITENKPNNESAQTRSLLSTHLSNFVPFDNMRDCLISFVRRVLTHSKHRNYELAMQCVNDCAKAMMHNNWVMYQLLLTHQLFEEKFEKNNFYNVYFIEDYVRFVANPIACSETRMQILGTNIKNVYGDILKRNLRLNLKDAEFQAIKDFQMCAIAERHSQAAAITNGLLPSTSAFLLPERTVRKRTNENDENMNLALEGFEAEIIGQEQDGDEEEDDDEDADLFSDYEDEDDDDDDDDDQDNDDEIESDQNDSQNASHIEANEIIADPAEIPTEEEEEGDNKDGADMVSKDGAHSGHICCEETPNGHNDSIMEENAENAVDISNSDIQNISLPDSLIGNANDSVVSLNGSLNASNLLPMYETAESSFSSNKQSDSSSPSLQK